MPNGGSRSKHSMESPFTTAKKALKKVLADPNRRTWEDKKAAVEANEAAYEANEKAKAKGKKNGGK